MEFGIHYIHACTVLRNVVNDEHVVQVKNLAGFFLISSGGKYQIIRYTNQVGSQYLLPFSYFCSHHATPLVNYQNTLSCHQIHYRVMETTYTHHNNISVQFGISQPTLNI